MFLKAFVIAVLLELIYLQNLILILCEEGLPGQRVLH